MFDVVFPKTTASLPMPDGSRVTVRMGQHWSADDPAVRQHPGVFAADPRYGLSFTVPPPEMADPPEPEIPRGESEVVNGGRRRRAG